jgi:tetratricopeptide (TPR) repeat protein
LQREPDNAQVWYLLGALYEARGDLAAAADNLERALRLRPGFAEALHHRGIVHARQGQLAEATAKFRDALRLKPGDAEVQTNLALALFHQGQSAETLALFQAVLQRQPNHVRAQTHLREVLAQQAHAEGVAYLEQGKLEEAAVRLGQALGSRAEFPEAYNDLGRVLSRQGKLAEAITCYQHALRLRPEYAEAHINLGMALLQQKQAAEAEVSGRVAIQLRPELAEAHNCLGLALLDQVRLDEASACFQRAVELKPAYGDAHNNLGITLSQLGHLDEALTSFDQALRLKPDDPSPHVNAALVLLMQGDFEKGWSEYERFWRRRDFGPRVFAQPRWDGSPLAGRTILLHDAPGLGDTLQFVRYARLAKEQGATVILECQRELLRLLARCPGIDQLVARGDPLPAHDVRAQLLLSLPYCFRTRLDTIPAEIPYLWADPTLVEHWRPEVAALPGFKIGINWQGRGGSKDPRSIPLREFAPLAAVPGVLLLSLQKRRDGEPLAAVAGQWPVTDLSARLDEEAGAFMDTAAVMQHLDLVVTCDTSIAHLAGALGVPVWVALHKPAEWRWFLDREDSPWYPTARLFRQEQHGDWRPVFQRIAQAVQQRLSSEPEA